MTQLYLGFGPDEQPTDEQPAPSDPGTKWCPCCERDLPRTEFYRLTRSRDGLQPRCKACDKGRIPSKRPKSPNDGRPVDSPTKWCNRCHQELPRSEFENCTKSRDGQQAFCRTCSRTAVKRQQQSDPEAYAAYQRRWREANPGKAAATSRKHYHANREESVRRVVEWRRQNAELVKAYSRVWLKLTGKGREYCQKRRAAKQSVLQVPFTLDQLKAKVAYWGEKCWMCGGPFEAIDHVKPLTKGGPHCLANARPACKSCNSKKSNKWPYPVRPARGY